MSMVAPSAQAERGRLQVGQRPPGVPAGQPDQVVQGLVVEADRAAQAALVGQRAADHLAHVVVAERLQGEQQRPGQQRPDHGERRVLGGRADERHPAVLHGGQQGVLLGLVEAVHLVDEQHRLGAGQAQFAPGALDRRAHVLHARGDRGQLDEAPAGDLADDVGQGGLAGARRAPQHHGHARRRSRPACAAASPRRSGAAGRPPRPGCAGASAPRAAPPPAPPLPRPRRRGCPPDRRQRCLPVPHPDTIRQPGMARTTQAPARRRGRVRPAHGGQGRAVRSAVGSGVSPPGGTMTSMPASRRCSGVIGVGAPVSGSAPDAALGKAITSRMRVRARPAA